MERARHQRQAPSTPRSHLERKHRHIPLQETLAPTSKPIKLRGYTSHNIPCTRGGSLGNSILVRNNIPSSPVNNPVHCGEGVDLLAVTILLHQTSLTTRQPDASTQVNYSQRQPTSLLLSEATSTLTTRSCIQSAGPTPEAATWDTKGTLVPLHPEVSPLNIGRPTHVRGGVLYLAFVSTPLRLIASFYIHPIVQIIED